MEQVGHDTSEKSMGGMGDNRMGKPEWGSQMRVCAQCLTAVVVVVMVVMVAASRPTYSMLLHGVM